MLLWTTVIYDSSHIEEPFERAKLHTGLLSLPARGGMPTSMGGLGGNSSPSVQNREILIWQRIQELVNLPW